MYRIDRMREQSLRPLGLKKGTPEGRGQAGYPRLWGARSRLPVRVAPTSFPLISERRKCLVRFVLLDIKKYSLVTIVAYASMWRKYITIYI